MTNFLPYNDIKWRCWCRRHDNFHIGYENLEEVELECKSRGWLAIEDDGIGKLVSSRGSVGSWFLRDCIWVLSGDGLTLGCVELDSKDKTLDNKILDTTESDNV